MPAPYITSRGWLTYGAHLVLVAVAASVLTPTMGAMAGLALQLPGGLANARTPVGRQRRQETPSCSDFFSGLDHFELYAAARVDASVQPLQLLDGDASLCADACVAIPECHTLLILGGECALYERTVPQLDESLALAAGAALYQRRDCISVPATGSCTDTSNGAVDEDNYACDYYTQNPDECSSLFDDEDFTIMDMCCGCGGGQLFFPTPNARFAHTVSKPNLCGTKN